MRSLDATLLAVDELTVSAGRQVLLHPLSFTLKAGEILTLIGESGAGKSLLLQAIMGNLPTNLSAKGKIQLGTQTSQAQDVKARRHLWGKYLALLPQEPTQSLDPLCTVHNVFSEVLCQVRGLPKAMARQESQRGLADVGLAHALKQYPWQLSGGMAQRAALCIASAGGAPVLMVDEPTKGLDAYWTDHTVASLRAWQAKGGAMLVITHDLSMAHALGGSVMVLQDGAVCELGTVDQVFNHPQHAYTKALKAADPSHWPRASVTGDHPPRETAEASSSSLVLSATGLGKRLGGRTLFRDVDLCIHAGQRWVIQGPSGVGKSTLGNVLLGLQRPDHGSVKRYPPDTLPHRFQKIYQDPVASFPAGRSLGAALKDVARRHRVADAVLNDSLIALHIHPSLLERRPCEVSGGQLQRIALVRALLVKPTLIFADEPTSRLDRLTQHQTMQYLCQVIEESGAALLLVTHDSDMAAAVATHVMTWDKQLTPSDPAMTLHCA